MNLFLMPCFNKQSHYGHLSIVKKICLQNSMSASDIISLSNNTIFCINTPPPSLLPPPKLCHLRALTATAMNRSKVVQERSLHWQSLITSID